MTPEEALALPVSVDLETANHALGIGRTTGYAMAKRGEYPIPLFRVGLQYRVTRANLLHFLGIEERTTP